MSNIAALEKLVVTLYGWMCQEQARAALNSSRMGGSNFFSQRDDGEDSCSMALSQQSMDWMQVSMQQTRALLRSMAYIASRLMDGATQQPKREYSTEAANIGQRHKRANAPERRSGQGSGAAPHIELPAGNGSRTGPVKSGLITSEFGPRWGRTHHGVDIAAPSGTPIVSTCNGSVIFAGWKSGYGNCVIVAHTKGGKTYSQLYGHCQKFNVHVGQSVKQGQNIACVGSTGHSTGPHLHYEERCGSSGQTWSTHHPYSPTWIGQRYPHQHQHHQHQHG